jgi:hypothetical protein
MYAGPYRPAFDPEAALAELSGTRPGTDGSTVRLSLYRDRIEEQTRAGNATIRRTLVLGNDLIVQHEDGRVALYRGHTTVDLFTIDVEGARAFCSAVSQVSRDLGSPPAVSIEYLVRRDFGFMVASLCSAVAPAIAFAGIAPGPWLSWSATDYFFASLPLPIAILFCLVYAMGRDRRLTYEHAGVLHDLPASPTLYRQTVDGARAEARL